MSWNDQWPLSQRPWRPKWLYVAKQMLPMLSSLHLFHHHFSKGQTFQCSSQIAQRHQRNLWWMWKEFPQTIIECIHCVICAVYLRMHNALPPTPNYSMFTLGKARSPLILNGQRAFLRANRLYHVSQMAVTGASASQASSSMMKSISLVTWIISQQNMFWLWFLQSAGWNISAAGFLKTILYIFTWNALF